MCDNTESSRGYAGFMLRVDSSFSDEDLQKHPLLKNYSVRLSSLEENFVLNGKCPYCKNDLKVSLEHAAHKVQYCSVCDVKFAQKKAGSSSDAIIDLASMGKEIRNQKIILKPTTT